MKQLETDRLILRAWQLDDLEDFYNNSKNPKVGPMAGWKPHENREESLSLLKSFIEADETWAIVIKDSGRVIGSVGLHEDNHRSLKKGRHKMLGYVLAEEYWGRGFIPEACKAVLNFAFMDMKLEIVSVCHFDFNTQSKTVIKKLGFKYEGTTRYAYERYDGKIFDECWYSMLKNEFIAKYKPNGYDAGAEKFIAVKMSMDTAREFLSWHYEKPYEIYNCSASEYAESLKNITEGADGRAYFAVYNELGDFSGVYAFVPMEDGRTELHAAISPELIGKGYGKALIRSSVDFCREGYGYRGELVIRVSKENPELMELCESFGFKPFEERLCIWHGNKVEFTFMSLEAADE